MNPGRPIALDHQLQHRLCQALKMGATIREACLTANLSEATFYRWVDIGKSLAEGKAHERMPASEHDQQALIEFVYAVMRARRHTRRLAHRAIRTAMQPHKQVTTRVETTTTTQPGPDGKLVEVRKQKVTETTIELPPNVQAALAYLGRRSEDAWNSALDE